MSTKKGKGKKKAPAKRSNRSRRDTFFEDSLVGELRSGQLRVDAKNARQFAYQTFKSYEALGEVATLRRQRIQNLESLTNQYFLEGFQAGLNPSRQGTVAVSRVTEGKRIQPPLILPRTIEPSDPFFSRRPYVEVSRTAPIFTPFQEKHRSGEYRPVNPLQQVVDNPRGAADNVQYFLQTPSRKTHLRSREPLNHTPDEFYEAVKRELPNKRATHHTIHSEAGPLYDVAIREGPAVAVAPRTQRYVNVFGADVDNIEVPFVMTYFGYSKT